MSEDKKTVYLLDGSSYIHRAYHAIRNLTNSKGFPTNAVLGVTKMVLKLMADRNPEYFAVVFDSKGPTFRHEIYKEYKANRPPMPEEMVVQLPLIKEILQKLGIRLMELGGYEADDIIGTMARVSQEKGFQVVMVTGDKDFRQLVTKDATLWDTMKDRVTDYQTIREEYGIEPEKFLDVMGLSGDTSDNIPGVRGVGEKTALDLIKQFGSMENLFKHLDQITKKKLRENLEACRDQAFLSRTLVTIDQFVPVDEDLNGLRLGEPSGDELAKVFRELEFRGLWDQFASRKELHKDYRLILSMEELEALARRVREVGFVSVDTETTGTEPMRADLVGISFCCEKGKAFYLPLTHLYLGVPDQISLDAALPVLKGFLEDETIAKIGQNIKYDGEVLKRHGMELRGIRFDTMIASYVIDPGLRQHNLDALAQHYLNHKMIGYHEVVGKGKGQLNFSQVDMERACEYSSEDADIALRLKAILEKRLKEEENEDLFYLLEMQLVPVLMEMEMSGIRIDADLFREMSGRFGEDMKAIEADIFAEAGTEFNINSSQQLGYVLFEKLGLPVQKKTAKSGRYSTDVKVLQQLSASAYKIPELLLRYRTLSKLKSTYLDALVKMVDPVTGRVHTSFNQTVAATGRLSSSNPNLQNIPIRGEEGRAIRKGFVADAGNLLVSADYSQVELRVFAHYSGDDAFIEAFRKDQDIHARTASEIVAGEGVEVTSRMRSIAKAINFGIIYGMGPKKLSDELGIDLKVAKDYIAAYYDRYQGVASYRDRMIATAREKGYVTTLLNRRRYLPDIQHANSRIRSEAERMAVNTPIQGTAADLIKQAMITIHGRMKKEDFRGKMLLQVHDELVFEVPEDELERLIPMVKDEMESVYPLDVPLKVDINSGKNWDEAH